MPSTKCGSTQMGAVVRMAAEPPPRATPAPCTQPCEEVLGQGSRAAHRSHRVIREREKLPHFSRKPLGRSGDSHPMQSINLHPHQQAAFQLQCPHAQLPTPFPAISLYCVLSLSPQPGACPPPPLCTLTWGHFQTAILLPYAPYDTPSHGHTSGQRCNAEPGTAGMQPPRRGDRGCVGEHRQQEGSLR